MKKIFLILAISVLALNVNAQLFLGGEIGINVKTDKVELENGKTSTFGIGGVVAPKLGYYFNDKLAIGLGLSFGAAAVSNKDLKYKQNTLAWGVAPFIKYHVFTYKDFYVALEGSIGLGMAQASRKIGDSKKQKDVSVLTVGILNVVPMLGYKLNDHLLLEAGLHFLNFGYNINKITQYEEGHERKNTQHDINVGFNSNNALVVAHVKVGVIYKF